MKKTMLLKILLILLPVMAVGLATTMDSVMVFDPSGGQTSYYSYFDALPVKNLEMITPLTALAAAVSGILAALYMAKKREYFLKGAGYAALASSCLAAIPMVVREDVLVVPNVGLPIFMVMEFVVSYMLQKSAKETSPKGPKERLRKR